ncbi:helix-turn-helix domain-containing protein [Actinomadura meridiana]|uniref:Helix-turn-helix domain-containing protein n=1 Tax=Actinomadura meridiana TaxID=559626 RepID=A0ABP8CRD2_9ACTN
MADGPRSACPINAAVEVLGDRWTLLVLRDILFGDRRHFRQLQSLSAERIASNILADRLRALVEAGLLTRDDPGRGRRATYTLTEPAIQLVPLIVQLGGWGARNRPTSPEARAGAELMEAGGPELWDELMAELRERHLDVPRPPSDGPTATDRLAAAYADALAR